MKKGTIGIGIITAIAGAAAGFLWNGHLKNKKIAQKTEKVDKFKNYYNMLNQWLMLKQEGLSLEKYFTDHNIKTIAIYGMGEMGNRLYSELKDSAVEIKYAIDKTADSIYSELAVCSLDDELNEVDAVVVTATFAFDSIREQLEEVCDYPVISLEDVVYGISLD
jgi:hypothetical protein